MRYAIIAAGVVVNAAVSDPDYAASQGWVDMPAGVDIGWLYDGQTFTAPPPVVRDPEEVKAEIVVSTQARLDAFAQTRDYDGILSACTYASSPTPRFASDGQYCLESRDATWSALYEILGEVLDGTRPMPSGYSEIESELPPLVWPA